MTARGDIFDAVYTALGGISTSDPTPYNFTVAKVEKVVRDWNDSETFPRPWIGFRPGNETYEYNPSHIIRCTMELNIVAHTSPVNGTVNNHYSDTEKMTEDILRALRQDVIRASCAESISLQQTQTSEGDPSAIDTASVAMLFNVIYYRTEPTT